MTRDPNHRVWIATIEIIVIFSWIVGVPAWCEILGSPFPCVTR